MKTSMLSNAAVVAVATLLAACGGEPSKTDAAATSTAAAATAAASAAATAPAKAGAAEAKATVVELKGAKGAQKISVVLPPGVMEVSDSPNMKSYRKGKDDFDGYSLTLGEDRPERAKGGLAIFLQQIEAQKEAKKTRLIDKDTWEGGWAIGYEFEEGGKKNVSVMASTTVGDLLVSCRGDATGSALSDVDAAAKLLMSSCKSIKPGG